MLGGGDLDGDEYFVVYEPQIVDAVITTNAHNYKTQNFSTPKASATIFVPLDHRASLVPISASKQLAALQKFIANGNLVADSADAWIRIADMNGVDHEGAQRLAELHQQSLDSRKQKFSIDWVAMNHVLETIPRPHYKSGKKEGKRSLSVLGVLFELWEGYINKIQILMKRHSFIGQHQSRLLDDEASQNDSRMQLAFDHMFDLDKDKKDQVIDGELHRYCISCNNPRGKKRCNVCGDAWVCLGQCEIKHWRLCFGIQWEIAGTISCDGESDIDMTFPKSCDSTVDTASLTSFDEGSYDMFNASPQTDVKDILESLIRIVFGHDPRPMYDLAMVNWKCVDNDAIKLIKQFVLVEFCEGFDKEYRSAREKTRRDKIDSPHIFDVFTMEQRLASYNTTLAVCVRNEPAGGLLMWRDQYEPHSYHPMNPPFHRFRIASLSGPSRILENLYVPPHGSLMDLALRRDPESFMKAVERDDYFMKCIPTSVAELLNSSQRRAVATVLSSDFKRGFFLVQGPPGTGKTVTLAAMVASLKGGSMVLASSNAAVANIAMKLMSIAKLSVHEIAIFGDNCNEHVEFLSPIHRSHRYHRFKKEYDIHKNDSGRQADLKREFISWLHLDTSTSLNSLMKHCPHIDLDSRKGQHFLTTIISSAKVVLSTLNTAGSHFLRKAVDSKYDTLFLDEAAQCTEAEFYIATNFPGVERIVLIGDPMQLNATVLNTTIKELGYGNSFMTNAMSCRHPAVHLLSVQYRCDPAIMRFSNQNFYNNALLTSRVVYNRKLQVAHPLLFINTGSGNEKTKYRFSYGKEERDGSSWKNHFEAQAVRILLRKDLDILKVREELDNATTMVITPYKSQADAIRKELNQANLLTHVKINTVDSFQGQEADIVIFSAVRTQSEGFTNDAQRLNVALTRAKRVLRVIGDWSFWSNTSEDSAMFKFVNYCNHSRLIKSDERLGKRAEAWLKPIWSDIGKYAWKPTMTSHFHHSLKRLSNIDRNIAFNTLLTISMPDEKSLLFPVKSKSPCWQQSALKGSEDRVQIVWVAKDANERDDNRPRIEAHFAGTADNCNKFRQTHPFLPKGTLCVKQGLTGVHTDSTKYFNAHDQSQSVDLAWTLNESLGSCILDDNLSELPDGYFDLDPSQSDIVSTMPPLLLESGSGTGKTNVLFKHAVNYAYEVRKHAEAKSICFVTVSLRLRNELNKRYHAIEEMERISLPHVSFFSLQKILEELVLSLRSSIKIAEVCSFREFVHSRIEHSALPVDIIEAENEISGVILGSIDAALKRRPLSRDEYIENKRSTVSSESQDGMVKRHMIYEQYEKYHKWKTVNARMDRDDVILELIRHMGQLLSKKQSLFDAVYLDEIQDFTYASIFLIFSIAGKSKLHWVCAGDTAQMISPGCSFKFDGLKQAMLAVKPGIETKIKRVVKLEKNYRVTKDVLDVSNSILKEAKKCFKNSIEYARPETAVKDLGTRVLWCYWEDAMEEKPSFGANQALIFTSTYDSHAIFQKMDSWLKSHPFILTTLDAKGLEFEDVVVAFDVDRKSWSIRADQVSSLRLLRELYVAITRAKRRVVILIKKDIQTMKEFFLKLEGCSIMQSDAKTAFLEFDSRTSSKEWFNRGMGLFENDDFKTASNCFKAAGDFAYFHWAQGKFEIADGFVQYGKESLRKSAHAFFEKGDYEHTLKLLASVMEMGWNSDDDYIYEKSRVECPTFFTPDQTIRFALTRDKWDEISISDLKSVSSASLFFNHRKNVKLVEKISTCSELDLESIQWSLPLMVGDYYLEREQYLKAVKLYLESETPDFVMAEKATNCIVQFQNSPDKTHMLIQVADVWAKRNHGKKKPSSIVPKDSDTFLLLHLFESPILASQSHPTDSLKKFGKGVIKSAFQKSNVPMETLHNFSQSEFEMEVRYALESKYQNKLIEAVQWYHLHKDERHAVELASDYIEDWTPNEFFGIIFSLNLPIKGIPEEASRRGINFQTELISKCMKENTRVDLAFSVTDEALSSIDKAQVNVQHLVSEWLKHRNNATIKRKLDTKKSSDKPIRGITFLQLLFKPKECSEQLQITKLCMELFGPKVVEYVISVSTNGEARYAVLSKFDPTAFDHLRPKEKSVGGTKSKASDSNSSLFQQNDRVVIKDIQQKPDLNGRQGTVIKYDAKSKRYGVLLDSVPNDSHSKKNVLAFKPSNLEKVAEHSIPRDEYSDTDLPSLASRNPSESSAESDDSSDSDSIPPLTTRNESSSEDNLSNGSDDESDSHNSSSDGSRLF
eukprot:CCRYP_008149-RB/>CCRYP_008149-RB protein AED:0.03 eAED:0.03 QI:2292/1/1/1/0.86/0.83/24/285/2253